MLTRMALTNSLAVLTSVLWLLGGALVADAQGRGGTQGRGQQPGQGKPAASQPRQGGQPGSGQQGLGRGAQDRDRIQLTDRQRDHLKDLSGAADRVRNQARTLTKSASGSGSDFAELRQQRDRLYEQVQTMARRHQELMAGFGDTERRRLEDRNEKLERARDQMHTCLGNLDRMLLQSHLDTDRLRRETREMERAASQWRKQVRKLGEDLGIG